MALRIAGRGLAVLPVLALAVATTFSGPAAAHPAALRGMAVPQREAWAVKGKSWAEEVLEAFALRAGTIKRPLRPKRSQVDRNRSQRQQRAGQDNNQGDRGD